MGSVAGTGDMRAAVPLWPGTIVTAWQMSRAALGDIDLALDISLPCMMTPLAVTLTKLFDNRA